MKSNISVYYTGEKNIYIKNRMKRTKSLLRGGKMERFSVKPACTHTGR